MTLTESAIRGEKRSRIIYDSPRKAKINRPIVVVIPTYNEEAAIARVIAKTNRVLSGITTNFHIIVVDDGSKDSTRRILDCTDTCERFFHRKNLGKGDVIRNVLDYLAPDEIMVLMDGDGEHEPGNIPRLLEPIIKNRAHMVIGSRFLGDGERNVRYLDRAKKKKFLKNFGNRLFSFMLWIFTRKRITDTQSGFRAVKTGVLKKLNLNSDGFRIEMEITIKAIRKGYIVKEIPIENGNPGRSSHLNPVIDGARILVTIFREVAPGRVRKFFDWLLPRIPRKLGRLAG